MPDINWNRKAWDGARNWDTLNQGERWSTAWGGSEPQWFGSLYPRLHRILPGENILELAPGMGRWTKFLLPLCDKYVGIDLSLKCVEGCRKVFADAKHARFSQNDGHSLDDAEDDAFDLIFSFDSLVHVEFDVMKSYVPQILRKLKKSGYAFIHHSNLGAFGTTSGDHHSRAKSVSGESVEGLITESGGRVTVQEVIQWGNSVIPHDCLTLFAKDPDNKTDPVHLKNLRFMEEAAIVREFQASYSRVVNCRG